MRFRFALIAILLVLLACAHSADRKQEPPISIGTELVTHGKIKIAYRTFGEGPTLVVINGGPGRASFHFTDLARRLSSYGFRVVLFDQRGTGDSKLTEVNEDTITLNAMVDDLEEVRT